MPEPTDNDCRFTGTRTLVMAWCATHDRQMQTCINIEAVATFAADLDDAQQRIASLATENERLQRKLDGARNMSDAQSLILGGAINHLTSPSADNDTIAWLQREKEDAQDERNALSGAQNAIDDLHRLLDLEPSDTPSERAFMVRCAVENALATVAELKSLTDIQQRLVEIKAIVNSSDSYVPQDVAAECLIALRPLVREGEPNTLLALVDKAMATVAERDATITWLKQSNAELRGTANDLIQQRNAASKDQIEISELLNCTEGDDDYIGALRHVMTNGKSLNTAIRAAIERCEAVRSLPGVRTLANELLPILRSAFATVADRATAPGACAYVGEFGGGTCGRQPEEPQHADLKYFKSFGQSRTYHIYIPPATSRQIDLMIEEAWPLADIVRKLADFAEDRLTRGSYDGDGHEALQLCVGLARKWLTAPLATSQPEPAAPVRKIDDKFHVSGSQIIKTSSGEVLPEDEPLWLTRGRDRLIVPTIEHYRKLSVADGCNDYHLGMVDALLAKFVAYASDPSRMKQPGITRGAPWMPGLVGTSEQAEPANTPDPADNITPRVAWQYEMRDEQEASEVEALLRDTKESK